MQQQPRNNGLSKCCSGSQRIFKKTTNQVQGLC